MEINYGTLLKRLIYFTDTKFITLAREVGYDVSYISKWCNNIKIPSSKNINIINDKAAKVFSSEIIKQNKIEKFVESFEADSYYNDCKDINQVIKLMLNSAYEKSSHMNSNKEEKKQKDIKFISGPGKIISFLDNVIKDIVSDTSGEINIITTVDVCSISKMLNSMNSQSTCGDSTRIKISMGFNRHKFESNPTEYLENIFNYINQNFDAEFTFYLNDPFSAANVLAVKNNFAMIFSFNSSGDAEYAIFITDSEIVDEVYKKTNSKFSPYQVVMKPTEIIELEESGYRTTFYSANEFCFFSAYGFEFLLPDNAVKSLIAEAKTDKYTSNYPELIKRLQITWEERFEKGKINYVLPKSVVMRYISDGEIYFTDVLYKLTIQERKEHAEKIIETMKKNSNIKFTILDDEFSHQIPERYKISVYVNDKKAFLKKNRKYITNNGPAFYVVTNKKIVKFINEYFNNLSNVEGFKEYDAKAVEDIFNTYGKMYLRMFDISE